jgi:hypothetical protein
VDRISTENSTGESVMMRNEGRWVRLLVRFDDPLRRSLRREFATDARRFYFTVAHEESDLRTIELLKK